MTKKIFLLLFAIFWMSGCTTLHSINEVYSRIDYSDGVNKKEARSIAQKFILDNNLQNDVMISMPFHGTSQQVDNCWLFKFEADFNVILSKGYKWYAVHVDKTTGEIKLSGWGPAKL